MSYCIGPVGADEGMEAVMHRIVQANIDKFTLLLQTESDPTKRTMLLRLLAEQEDEKRKLATKPKANDAY